MKLTYRHTRNACFTGYVTQAIVNNLCPLLFLTFQQQFSITLSQISLIITLNFIIQMVVDLLSARWIDGIGYRKAIVFAHASAAAGLAGLCFFPLILPPYTGLLIATFLNAVGGGLLEVLVSPMVEALPSEHKEREMSLLHSFYCWGHMAVVILSTVYFLLFGIQNWRYLPLLWALVPLMNGWVFIKAPLCTLAEAGRTLSVGKLIRMPLFWLMFLLMICSGASEQAVSQWASLFAEEGLRVSKTLGDLLGPCAFALLMGISRVMFSRGGLSIHRALFLSGLLCILSYLTIVFSPWPLVSLIACAVCGFSVGVMWPGVFSLSSVKLPSGGTAMFALLALAGDIGCCAGPSLVGAVSDGLLSNASGLMLDQANPEQGALRVGFFAAMAFPLILSLCMLFFQKKGHAPEQGSPNP